VLGSASATAFNKVRKTAHVAFCGKDDEPTSVIGTGTPAGPSPFWLAPTIAAHRSMAFGGM
jgi:hypothetical protein